MPRVEYIRLEPVTRGLSDLFPNKALTVRLYGTPTRLDCFTIKHVSTRAEYWAELNRDDLARPGPRGGGAGSLCLSRRAKPAPRRPGDGAPGERLTQNRKQTLAYVHTYLSVVVRVTQHGVRFHRVSHITPVYVHTHIRDRSAAGALHVPGGKTQTLFFELWLICFLQAVHRYLEIRTTADFHSLQRRPGNSRDAVTFIRARRGAVAAHEASRGRPSRRNQRTHEGCLITIR